MMFDEPTQPIEVEHKVAETTTVHTERFKTYRPAEDGSYHCAADKFNCLGHMPAPNAESVHGSMGIDLGDGRVLCIQEFAVKSEKDVWQVYTEIKGFIEVKKDSE